MKNLRITNILQYYYYIDIYIFLLLWKDFHKNDVPEQFFWFWSEIALGHVFMRLTHDNLLWSGVTCEYVLTLNVFACAGDGDRVGEQVWPAGTSTGGPGCCPAVGTWGEGQTLGGDGDRQKLINRTLHQPHQPPHTATEQVCLSSARPQEQGNPLQRHLNTAHCHSFSTMFGCLHFFQGT